MPAASTLWGLGASNVFKGPMIPPASDNNALFEKLVEKASAPEITGAKEPPPLSAPNAT